MHVQTRSHRYDEIGFPGVILENVRVQTCNQCGLVAPVIDSVADLHGRIAVALVLDPRRISPAEFRFLRTVLELDTGSLAKVMGLKPKTVERWEAGIDPIGKVGERLLRALVFCERQVDAGGLFELTRSLDGKDLQCILNILKPEVGPRILRLKGRVATYQSWVIHREPAKAANPPVAPVRLVLRLKSKDRLV